MPKELASLNLFPTYATREAYTQGTGKPCPPWNPTLPPKDWEDPAALGSDDDYIVYDRLFVGLDAATGKPKWKRQFLPKAQAATVNIPPRGEGMTNVPGADVAGIPCPKRELHDDEVIKPGFGNVPMVYTAAELEALRDPGADFTADERKLIVKAAQKVLS